MKRSLRKWLKYALWFLAAAIPLTAIFVVTFYFSFAKELDEKFFAAVDSSPTKVYSRVFWLRPGVGASTEELRYRLKEREYREVSVAEQVQAPGQYALLANANGGVDNMVIFTKEFHYPSQAKEALILAHDGLSRRYEVQWSEGDITSIRSGEREFADLPLEPVLVAQLNEGRAEARRTVPISEIPHTLLKGIVLIEDQRFLEHVGLDPRGILRSLYVNLRHGGYVQGASTITQQLTRNIYLSRQKTIVRKLKEMLMALLLEWRYSKDQILEKYLNEVYFGQFGNVAIHGVSEAAKFYFDKSLDELSIAEQAMLAAIVRGPFYYSPFRNFDRVKSRQELVLKKMLEAGVITEAQYNGSIREKLRLSKVNPVQNRAPYFTDMIQSQLLRDLPEQEVIGAGYTIFSTLDTYYQSLAEASLARGVGNLEARLKQALSKKKSEDEAKTIQGIFLCVDPRAGHLLCMVGGRSYEESTYNRALLMRRHVGSLMKPFVYLAALMFGKNPDNTPLNAISKFEDKPFKYEYDGKEWSPKNYDDDFAGTVTLRYALANSINTVAAQVAISTGLDKVVEVAQRAGFSTPLAPLPSLSLGAVEISPIEVATAYASLANFGLKKEITATLLIVAEDGHLVARFFPREDQTLPREETANLVHLMTTTMESGTARASKDLGFTWPAAGKTGTTNEFRDAWFAGFSDKLLGITWVGFDRDDDLVRKQRKALKLTGAVAALPIWVDFMKSVHKGQPKHPINFPSDTLRTVAVDLISGSRANQSCAGANVAEEIFTYKNVPFTECQ